MDPSQVQTDPTNDVHSLEQTDSTENTTPTSGAPAPVNADAGDKDVTDATGGSPAPVTPPQPKKKSPLKRLWDKLNIYLLLFILVVVVAVGILVVLTIKSNKPTKNALATQNLSQQELQQLASTDVTVGNPKQVLTVQANAVFAGAVLIRSNLEVAGSLKVGGELSLNSLTVGGATQLSDVQANNLTLTGSLNLQGSLTLKNGINVTGNSNFSGNVTTTSLTTGSLQLNGDLNLTHHITAGGTTPNISRGTATGGGGTASLSGSDTSGSIAINTGSSPPAGCFATITFTQKFTSTPHIVITPIGSAAAGLQYYIDRTTSSFTICSATAAAAGQTFGFDYIALD
jgi:cytoskeletal protein CcmA (bactofilin family)